MMLRRYKHALILGGMALLAIAGLVFDAPAYTRGVSYHGFNDILLSDGTYSRLEERLIIGDVSSFAAMERVGEEVNYASLTADVVHFGPRSLDVRLQKAVTSRARPMTRLSEMPDLLFDRQYGLATGATLRLQFLPVQDSRVICYYAREIDNVRCLNR
ncbi:hypothetical protein [Metapseudomonas resinovorans]|uniref:Uncharacterized protein n=1 Tax=Metapseudomonas resinovorans NBRC 106553 TaxID=1245471 RepID=S6BKN1_METRE|nr:hypothetical protein [Pseudomonas resinovorans]BAN49809.1 hypothetical protein PCA10_40770 [Pseudomonas resinovorans NBRC 106553]